MNGNDKNKGKVESHEKPVAYIAGALNAMSADYILNVRRMILWGDQIRKLGFAVFIPGIDFLCGVVTGTWDYGIAFNNSQAFLARADIMFVCPKWEKSAGTKKEIRTATKLCVPVYYEQSGLDLLNLRLKSYMAFTNHPLNTEAKRNIANSIALDQNKPTRDVALHNLAPINPVPMKADYRDLMRGIKPSKFTVTVKKCCGTCQSFGTRAGSIGFYCNWFDPNWPIEFRPNSQQFVDEEAGKDCSQWVNKHVK